MNRQRLQVPPHPPRPRSPVPAQLPWGATRWHPSFVASLAYVSAAATTHPPTQQECSVHTILPPSLTTLHVYVHPNVFAWDGAAGGSDGYDAGEQVRGDLPARGAHATGISLLLWCVTSVLWSPRPVSALPHCHTPVCVRAP